MRKGSVSFRSVDAEDNLAGGHLLAPTHRYMNEQKLFHRHGGLLCMLAGLLAASGCAALPEISREPQFHNPFPQLHRIAVLPFVNQSPDPTINGAEVANLYRSELQKIKGFEVLPVGVVEQYLKAREITFDQATDFQQLAQALDVDAVVIGSITDFDAYYPPQMGLAVNWYAANPGFHPIPPGYGLPWGTTDEEFIPEDLVFEAEFALAREQLETQTPRDPAFEETDEERRQLQEQLEDQRQDLGVPGLPADWPDPRGFIPPGPNSERPPFRPQSKPIMQLIRQYDGADNDFTTKLANYYYFRDDGRIDGWEAYLRRQKDFVQFCCYLHITELLTARGGGGETRLVLRWPFDRYQE